MAGECWIVNASPLILLGKAGLIDMLSRVAGEIVVPQAVVKEIMALPGSSRFLRTYIP